MFIRKPQARSFVAVMLLAILTPQPGEGGPKTPWVTAAVGSVAVKGSASTSWGGRITVSGEGTDIWGTADGFQYLYQRLSGNMQISAKITDLQNTNAWAKAGLMIRQGLTAGSVHASLFATPSNGIVFQQRTATGGLTTRTAVPGGAPVWLRLTRVGAAITASVSIDGATWADRGRVSVPMAADVFVGLAVTSRSPFRLTTARFEKVTIVKLGTAPATPPPGPVAAWSFDDGAGRLLRDSAGGLDGVISGATWTTAGRYRGALLFNGVDQMVTVPADVALNLTTGMTLEAWVYPTSAATWRNVAMKEGLNDLAYALYASDASSKPQAAVNMGAGQLVASGTAQLPANVWSHLAATFDGSTHVLYVNGLRVGSVAAPGALWQTTGSFRIGGNSLWGGWFDGAIDDMRVYNRALSLTEIQADMNTPVASPPPDTTRPTVTISTPVTGATVSGTVSLAATATDDVGVASVQFLLNGVNLGGAVSAAPYVATWSTQAVPNGTYKLTAVARDHSGNANVSADVSVAVSNASTPVTGAGPVAAWSFDDGAGRLLRDSAGGLDGVISGATWTTAGRYRGALLFNGVDQMVTVPADVALNLTTGMTLEAWVYPKSAATWRNVAMKEGLNDLAYALYASDASSKPQAAVNMGAGQLVASGTAQLPANVWSHLAATFDGSTHALYVNGVRVGSVAAPGALWQTTGSFRIGGNSLWGGWFDGAIDDMRVYNRALSLTEIQADMNTPVASPPPDTTRPTVTISTPVTGATVSGTVSLAATATDDVGVASVQFLLNGVNLGGAVSAAPYVATWSTQAVPNGTYKLTAVARDHSGNANVSADVSVAVSNASTPVTGAGPVAAWSFDDGAGRLLRDSAGGLDGVISGATWTTAGRYRGALLFNGVDQMVTVPADVALNLTTGMTLEAWVYPKSAATWRNVAMKEGLNDLAYALYASDASSKPQAAVNMGAGQLVASGTAQLPANVWSHLAATFDGSTHVLYVNGLRVGSVAAPGALWQTTGSFRIGGNSLWGGWFDGAIDDMRVYNRALSLTEIQADMNTPVASPPPDTTPPTVAISTPVNGGTVSGTVGVVATAADDVGVASVQFLLNGVNLGGAVSAAPYVATWSTQAVPNGTYKLTAVARDHSGNANVSADVSVAVNNASPFVIGRTVAFTSLDHLTILPDGRPTISGYILEVWLPGSNTSTGQPYKTSSLGKPESTTTTITVDQQAFLGSLPKGQEFFATTTATGPGGSARSGASNSFMMQ